MRIIVVVVLLLLAHQLSGLENVENERDRVVAKRALDGAVRSVVSSVEKFFTNLHVEEKFSSLFVNISMIEKRIITKIESAFLLLENKIEEKLINSEKKMVHEIGASFQKVKEFGQNTVAEMNATVYRVKRDVSTTISNAEHSIVKFGYAFAEEFFSVLHYVIYGFAIGVTIYVLVNIQICIQPALELFGTTLSVCNTSLGFLLDYLTQKRRQTANRRAVAQLEMQNLAAAVNNQ